MAKINVHQTVTTPFGRTAKVVKSEQAGDLHVTTVRHEDGFLQEFQTTSLLKLMKGGK